MTSHSRDKYSTKNEFSLTSSANYKLMFHDQDTLLVHTPTTFKLHHLHNQTPPPFETTHKQKYLGKANPLTGTSRYYPQSSTKLNPELNGKQPQIREEPEYQCQPEAMIMR